MIAARRQSGGHLKQQEEELAATQVVDRDSVQVAAALEDPYAFAPLYDRYFDSIHGYCLRRIGNPDDAADATSQIFTNALHGLRNFRSNPSKPGSSFRSWLFSIAHNVVIDVYRRRRQTVSLEPDDPASNRLDSATVVRDPGPSPEDLAISMDSHISVVEALAQLPERQRSIIELRLAGLSHAEIAGALELSSTAIRSAQYRGMTKLRELLDSADDDANQ